MNDVFKLTDRSCNTTNNSHSLRRIIETVLYGPETLFSLGPQIWDVILPEMRT